MVVEVEFRMDVYAKGNGNGRKWINTGEVLGSRLQQFSLYAKTV